MGLEDKRILVVGGTGMLGKPVVQMLDHFGFPVRVFTRNPDRARQIFGQHFDIAVGDIADKSSLRRALEGSYGVHINLKGGPKPGDFDRIEHRGTASVVAMARETGVKKATYLSGATVSIDRCWFPAVRAKYKAEQAIIQSGLDYSIFRASWFMESLPLFARDNQALIMGQQPNKYHWLAAEDYARMVTRSYLLEETSGKTFLAFGPEAYTFREALEIFARIVNPGIRVSMVPLWLLSIFAVITFSRQLKEALPHMRYFQKNGELGNPAEADDILGQPDMTLEQWCTDYNRYSELT